VRSRRRTIQQGRVIADAELVPLLSSRIDPGNFELPIWLRPFDSLLALHWAITKRLVRRRRTNEPGVTSRSFEEPAQDGVTHVCPSRP
jgi:hypothetical protein